MEITDKEILIHKAMLNAEGPNVNDNYQKKNFQCKVNPTSVFLAKLDGEDRIQAIHRKGNFCLCFPLWENTDTDEIPKKCVRVWVNEMCVEKERLKEISDYLQSSHLPYFIDFKFDEKGLNLEDGTSIPAIYMEWINGDTLSEWIPAQKENPEEIEKLAKEFSKMCCTFNKLGIAHGDLCCENILVNQNGEIKLVDYDSVYVPSMGDRYKPVTSGWKDFQLPKRNKQKTATAKDDYFSQHLIFLSLLFYARFPDFIPEQREKSLIFISKNYIDQNAFVETDIYGYIKENCDGSNPLDKIILSELEIMKESLEKDFDKIEPLKDYFNTQSTPSSNAEILRLENKVKQLIDEKAALEKVYNNLKDENRYLKDKIDSLKREIDDLKTQINLLSVDNQRLRDKIVSLEKDNKELKDNNKRLYAKNQNLTNENGELKDEVKKLKDRIGILRIFGIGGIAVLVAWLIWLCFGSIANLFSSTTPEQKSGVEIISENGKYGLYNHDADKQTVACEYDEIYFGGEEMSLYVLKKNNLTGVADSTGEMTVECTLDSIQNIHYGLVKTFGHGKQGLLDNFGNVILTTSYHAVLWKQTPLMLNDFYETGDYVGNIIPVQENDGDLWIMFNRKGERLGIQPYKQVYQTGDPDMIKVSNSSFSNYGVINIFGQTVIPFEYSYRHISNFGSHRAWIKQDDNSWNCVNEHGNTVFNLPADAFTDDTCVKTYHEGLCAVIKDNLITYYDTEGKIAIPAKYKIAKNKYGIYYDYNFYNGVALVSDGTNNGRLEKNGKFTVDESMND